MSGIIIDLYCGAGGASEGYRQAGFTVIGADIADQPRYPFKFVKGDAIDMLPWLVRRFDPVAVHAGPPCQRYTAGARQMGTADTHPDLVDPTRVALEATRLPYVIENVPTSPVRRDIMLCGGMFGLRLVRHRHFELGGWSHLQPPHPRHSVPCATRRRRERWNQGWNVTITGDVGTYLAVEAMGIDWMIGNELSEAIPPAYTRYIGDGLRRVLRFR